MKKTIAYFDEPTDFSLVQGGPLFQLFLRVRLLKPPTDLVSRRVLVVTLLAWLPLLMLSAFSNHALGGVAVPFMLDVGCHARLLLSVPLFIAAEVIVHRRMRTTVMQFLDRNIVATEDRPKFENIIASAMRLRNSMVAEILLLVFVIIAGFWASQRYLTMGVASWHTVLIDGQSQVTPAGYWYFFVSMAIFRFLILRWYFRLFVWYRFLWQISRQIKLRLNPLHPDLAGGLGFLSLSVFAFVPVLLAQSILVAGHFGGKIWHEGATLPQFKMEILAWIFFLLALVLTPLCFFIWQLGAAKRTGLGEYGILASQYVSEFREKWFESHAAKNESLVGSADIQSLADLSGGFEAVREMRLIPIGKVTVLRLAILIALPIAPLLLTMVPLEELIDSAVGVLF